MEAFSSLRTPAFALDESEIRTTVEGLCYSAGPVFTGDRFAVNHYLGGGRYIWIDRKGVDLRADTLLSALRSVGDVGFSMRSFFVDEITRQARCWGGLSTISPWLVSATWSECVSGS